MIRSLSHKGPTSCLRATSHGIRAAHVDQKRSLSGKPEIPRKFPTSALSYHWDTLPPTIPQLRHAREFFDKRPPEFLWSAPKFKTMEWDEAPEVCFLGRSNVGKSSILNALLGKKVAHTSSKPGRTKHMNAFAVGGKQDTGKFKMVVLDMPGYGKGGQGEWGEQVLKYLSKRAQLKRAFLLIDSQHGLKTTDLQLIGLFKEKAIPYQIVMSKVDKVLFSNSTRIPGEATMAKRILELWKSMEDVKIALKPNIEDDGAAIGEIIACSSEKWLEGSRLGVDNVRFAMLRACGLEFQPKVKLAAPIVSLSPSLLEAPPPACYINNKCL